ncbi:MAG: F-box protein, partial [Verrucomicrobia bacterium]|nr:F-box protein [Verrucomicrobiota bacterium]
VILADPNPTYLAARLPPELIQRIFNSLSSAGLCRAALGCKLWYAHVREVRCLQFPVIKEDGWRKFVDLEKYGLKFDELEFPSREDLMVPALDLARHVEEDQGVSIIAIPKGLSLSKLLAIAEEWGVPRRYIWAEIEPAIGTLETKRPYIALISNSVLQGSRDKTNRLSDAFVQEKGYEVPSTIELLSLMVFNCIKHSKRLFSDDRTHALTSDSVHTRRLAIGGFTPSGFIITHFAFIHIGVAAVRRF